MRKFKLLFLQVKSAFGYYFKGLSILAALFIAVTGCFFVAWGALTHNNEDSLIRAGVVSASGDQVMDYLISMIQTVDGVSSICSMEKMDEDYAMKALDAGEVSLVIYVPDDFYALASTLQDTSMSIYVKNEPNSVQKKLFAMLGGAENLMGTTEGGILAMYEGMSVTEIPVTKGEMEADLFADAVWGFMNRDDIFTFSSLSVFGNYSVVQYYIASAWVMLIMLSGMFFMGMYRHGEKQLERLVFRGPLSGLWATIGRILSMTLVSGGLVSSLGMLINIVLSIYGIEFFSFGIRSYGCIWLIALSVSAWVHLFASITEDSAHSRVIYILSVFLIAALTGVIVPSVYTPSICKNLSPYLPGGTYHGLLLDGIWGKRRLDGVNIIIITDVFVFVASTIAYTRRLRKHD